MTTVEVTRDRPSRRAEWLLSAIPWISIVLVGSLLMRARLVLGDWPQPAQPDPKDISALHHALALVGLTLSIAATFVLVMVSLFRLDTGRVQTARPLWFGLAGLVLLSFAFSGTVGAWIMD